ncbi:MAG TPA: trypsin-like serine protease [Micromonosporaceae bacterium]|nr:trypsin-like serine protease [Micromonosporaceae bacterium]
MGETTARIGRWLGVLVGVVAVGLVPAVPAGAVANGEPVREGTYRFAVRLTMPDITRPDGTHYSSACSAALIGSRWIIGAGHCFHDGARNRISGPVRYEVIATVGTADLDSGNGIVRQVVEVWQAPDRDIAVGRLDAPVRGVKPVELNSRAPRVGDTLRIAGWGWTGEGEFGPSSILYTGKFSVSSVAATTVGVTGLAPSPDTSACAYDSGAPYFAVRRGRPYLVSVENTGPDCPHSEEETTARIDTLRSWIRDTAR